LQVLTLIYKPVIEDFKNQAKQAFEYIFNLIEEKYQDIDVDFEEENLVIEAKKLKYILSIHTPSFQIWMSSPVSGAHHFKFKKEDKSSQWISTRDDSIKLFEQLEKEFTTLI
jgi:frataxin|tara:strand:+ start:349 stop:684 length:336 start_codon:yes stop_codon:yes gene_type:complete